MDNIKEKNMKENVAKKDGRSDCFVGTVECNS